jgi:hypothetical protein
MRSTVLALSLIASASLAQAGVITFKPAPKDMGDLSSESAYTWGINWSIPAGEQILEARIFIDDIRDSRGSESDSLSIQLLDSPEIGKLYTSGPNSGLPKKNLYVKDDGNAPGDWFETAGFSGEHVLLDRIEDAGGAVSALSLLADPEDYLYYLSGSEIAALTALDREIADLAALEETLGVALKSNDDIDAIRGERLSGILARAVTR